MKSDIEIMMDALVTLTLKQMELMKNYPVAKFYENVSEFMEQTTNDLIASHEKMK